MSEEFEQLIKDLPSEEQERIRDAQVYPTEDRPAFVASLDSDYNLTVTTYPSGEVLFVLGGIHQGEDLKNYLEVSLPVLQQELVKRVRNQVRREASK